MRFAELHLLKYGNFEGCDLHFPRQPMDFHVIFGANEAGKSTTLTAVGDLLFGFPHGRAQDYRFDASLLRVGAVLEADEQRTQVRRKRGRGTTLMDGQDNAVDEAVLAAMLHGQTRETFHAAWSLDHRLLREGGEAIVNARNDLGQALFAAGSGLTGVTAILETLAEEGDQIWGSRAKASRSYTRVSNDLKDAERRQRAAEVRPAAWKSAYDQLQELERRQTELDIRQKTLTAEQRTVERTRRVLEPVEQLHALRTSLGGQTAPLFTPALEAQFDAAFALRARAVLQQEIAERLLAEEQEHLRAIVMDQPCLERESEIEALIEERGLRLAAANGLPAKLARLEQKKAELAEALRTLRLPVGPAATLLLTLPARTTVAELKKLLGERTALDTARRILRDAHADAVAERDAAARALADHTVLETAAELQAVVGAARRMDDLDGQAEQARRVHAEHLRQAEDAFARLLPWSGSVEALRRLAVPSEELLQAAREREFTAAAALAEEAQQAGRLREELAHLSLQRELLVKAGTGVSPAAVAEARALRDACWAGLRAHLEGTRPLASPGAEAARHEALAEQADRRADERFLSAEVSGRLVQMDAAVATAELQLANATARVEQAVEAQRQARSLWSAELAGRALPVLEAARLREWLTLRDEALAAEAQAATSAASLRAHEAALETARQTLAAATARPAAAKSFRRLLDDAEAILEATLESDAALTQRKNALHKAEEAVRGESRKVERNLDETRAWQETWKQAVTQAHLDETVGVAELDTVELVRTTAASVQQLQDETEAAGHAQGNFLLQTRSLWAALQMPGQPEEPGERVETLKRRLQTAREARQRAGAITLALEAREAERRKAEAERTSAEGSLGTLLDLAGVAELPALSERVEESRRVRRVLDEIAAVKQRILSLGDGIPLAALLAEAEGETPDRLASRADELAGELTRLSGEIRDAADLAGVSRTNFQALDHGAAASEAAGDAEMARAELDVQAEAYLLKRTEYLLLNWAVERKRKRTQNPLLLRAGQLFSILTANRYSSLLVSDEGSAAELLGNCADGSRPVPVGNMSEGTVDQLFLALRVAAIEQSVKAGSVLPVLADDLFINFDDQRAEAGFRVLGELARSTQVLFFTHHRHLLDIARKSLHPHEAQVCNL